MKNNGKIAMILTGLHNPACICIQDKPKINLLLFLVFPAIMNYAMNLFKLHWLLKKLVQYFTSVYIKLTSLFHHNKNTHNFQLLIHMHRLFSHLENKIG